MKMNKKSTNRFVHKTISVFLLLGLFAMNSFTNEMVTARAQEAISQPPVGCYPGTGWVWTIGPHQPETALQAKVALDASPVEPTLPPWNGWLARLEGVPGTGEQAVTVGAHAVDSALYGALGLELIAGRIPAEAEERSGARLAVVSRALAARLAGSEDAPSEAALGRAVRFAPGEDLEGELTVVGVVENVAWDGRSEQDTQRIFRRGDWRGDLFVPLGLMHLGRVSIAVVTRGEPGGYEPAVRRAIAAVAPTSPIHWNSTMADELAAELRPARFLMLVVDAFAAAALALAGAGLFGFLSTAVLARRRELGLRGALGASPLALARLIAGEALRLLVPALAVAALGVALLQPVLRSVLHEVAPHDLAALGGALALLLLAALAALALPLRSTLAIDPAVALRDE
jgi:hypothetical protein